MRKLTQRITVTENSLEGLIEDGFDPSTSAVGMEDVVYGKYASRLILSQLTSRQRKIVIYLEEGLKRPEIAENLMISVQEVHQIIARIRRRVEERDLDEEHMQTINNAVYWLNYYRGYTAKQIYDGWSGDPIMKDYPRPALATLRKWIKGYGEQ